MNEPETGDFEAKYEKAMQELKGTPIWKSNYNPPFYKLIRRLGIQSRPPHYNTFLSNSYRMSLYFAAIWAVFLLAFSWTNDDISKFNVVIVSILIGMFFGVVMGIYYWYSFRTNSLTEWEKF